MEPGVTTAVEEMGLGPESDVDSVRKNHSRKYSFIGDFEQIVAGHRPDVPESFEKRARKKWKKQTSK
ncbi:MAG: hypothetical protein U5R49_23060 [Deltaproteobacteria bacterium]|nr:hypothetical protein [Deltaproteobacteria bacterium]